MCKKTKLFQIYSSSTKKKTEIFRADATTLVDCKEGIDFESHNGTLATVLMKGGKLHFVVWKNRFPDLTPPKGMFFSKDYDGNGIKAEYHFISTDNERMQIEMSRMIYV